MAQSLRVKAVKLYVLNLRARMPFRYGIATLTALPHLFVQLTLEVDGRDHVGLAADHLVPKWFTKLPGNSFRDDVVEMLDVIRSACRIAERARPAPSVFALWQRIYAEQRRWGDGRGYPPLLYGFGASLIERAMIDAFCRSAGVVFARAVRDNLLGIQLGDIYPVLAGASPSDWLAREPLHELTVRHTVGLSDPLADKDIPAEERLTDGLPQSLEACIRQYGLTHFKVKLCGQRETDLARIRSFVAVVERVAGQDYAVTLDGNEMVRQVDPLKSLWLEIQADADLTNFRRRLLFVEQPLHRDVALSSDTADALQAWAGRPPIIIDESDGALTTLTAALETGYAGTSHKNCKGVFKGIANACLIEYLRRAQPGEPLILSAEDLSNVGPVALLQDLAVVATLGIRHAERNGHHYFTGLAWLPEAVQQSVLAGHGDAYRRHELGFPTLNVAGGRVKLDSIVAAPFGLGVDFDPSRFTPLDEWQFESLDR